VGDCGTDFLPNYKRGREFGTPVAPFFLSLKVKGGLPLAISEFSVGGLRHNHQLKS